MTKTKDSDLLRCFRQLPDDSLAWKVRHAKSRKHRLLASQVLTARQHEGFPQDSHFR